MIRRSSIAVLTSTLLAASVGLWASNADAIGRARWVHVEFEAATPAPVFDETSCDPSGRCLISYSIGTGTLTGDAQGEIVSYGTMYFDPVALRYTGSSYQLFTGHVDGCGDGTFVMALPSFKGGVLTPTTASGEVVVGSGTGELAGVKGKVTDVFTTLADGSGATTGDVMLWCKPH